MKDIKIRNTTNTHWLKVDDNYGLSNKFKIWDNSRSRWRRAGMTCRTKIRNASNTDWVIPYDYLIKLNTPLHSAGEGKDRSFYSIMRTTDYSFDFLYSTDSAIDPALYGNSYVYDSWLHSASKKLIGYAPYSTTLAAGDIITSNTPIFYNQTSVRGQSGYYKNVMFFINQPSNTTTYWANYGKSVYGDITIRQEPTSTGWGLVYVSFSNDLATGWTIPCQLHVNGEVVYAENISVIFHNGILYLFCVEGDFNLFFTYTNTKTYLKLLTANPSDVLSASTYNTGNFFTSSGIVDFNPNIRLTTTDWTKNDLTCFNATFALDPITGYCYMARAYRYPHHFNSGSPVTGLIPCNGSGVNVGLGQMPNRVQLYRKYLGSPINAMNFYSGSWELLKDVGYSHGYYIQPYGSSCQPTALNSSNQISSIDVNTLSILRNNIGYIHPLKHLVMAGDIDSIRTRYGVNQQNISAYMVPSNFI